MLQIKNLETGYGKRQVLFSLSLEVHEAEVVALIGPNGAGKSTVLKAACGIVPVWSGEIRFRGRLINGAGPASVVASGITLAPQGNRVFGGLTVAENMEIGGSQLTQLELRQRTGEMLQLFPSLRARLRQDASTLSGGEQQMLALARALVSNPKLLMLDEPSLGLSPGLVRAVFDAVHRVNSSTRTAILIVDHRVREVLEICDRVYSMKIGRVAFAGAPQALKGDTRKLRDLFL